MDLRGVAISTNFSMLRVCASKLGPAWIKNTCKFKCKQANEVKKIASKLTYVFEQISWLNLNLFL